VRIPLRPSSGRWPAVLPRRLAGDSRVIDTRCAWRMLELPLRQYLGCECATACCARQGKVQQDCDVATQAVLVSAAATWCTRLQVNYCVAFARRRL